MRTVSTRFLAALRESHLVESELELLFVGAEPVLVPLEGGEITLDRTAQVRRSGNVSIPWSLVTGRELGLDLRTLPLGGYARVWRGIHFGDGTRELVLLGTFRVESVAWLTVDDKATLELADRMAQVRDEGFTAPYSPNGLRAAGAAYLIAYQVFGEAIRYRTLYDPAGVLTDTIYTESRADAIAELAQSVSAEAYFDAEGNYVFRRVELEEPVWTVDTGEDGVMLDANEQLDRTGIYNGVYVEGQPNAKGVPVSALVVDSDPSSPTRWGGPYGRVPRVERSRTDVLTAAQAQNVARSLLARRLGLARSLTLSTAPNPALEPDDTLRIRFVDGREELHIVDSIRLDLGPEGAQTIETSSYYTPAALQWAPLPELELELPFDRTSEIGAAWKEKAPA
jgi:hypothetical protein